MMIKRPLARYPDKIETRNSVTDSRRSAGGLGWATVSSVGQLSLYRGDQFEVQLVTTTPSSRPAPSMPTG